MEQINPKGNLFKALPVDVTKIIIEMLEAEDFARCTRVDTHWNRDLVFLLDEVHLSTSLLRHLNYYLDNIKKFNCRRIEFSFSHIILQKSLYPLVIQLPKLTELTLNEPEGLNPSSLQMFSTNKQIKKLHYDHLLADQRLLNYLAEYTQLVELDLFVDVQLVAQVWEVLLGMPKLRKLSIKARGPNPSFTVNWNAISSLESLKLVNMTFRPFDTVEGCNISVMTNLTHLAIHGPYSGTIFAPLLANHTQLRELVADALSRDMLASPMLQHVTSLKCNRALRIDETVPKLPNLVSLAWRPSTPGEIDFISRHSNLTYLEMRGTNYENIDKLLKLTKLKYLVIRTQMTKEIASVITKLPNLAAIDTLLPQNIKSVDDYKKNFHRTFNLPDHLLALWTHWSNNN